MLFLIRHAKPLIDFTSCKYDEALKRLNEYNETTRISLKEIGAFKESESFEIIKKLNPTVYTSPLPRAYLTCDKLFGKGVVLNDLTEIDLEIAPIPYVKLSIPAWFAISRVFWYFGYNNPKESENEVKERISRLIKYIHPNEHVALVCHGGLMHYMKQHPYIKRYYKLVHTENYGILTLEIWDDL